MLNLKYMLAVLTVCLASPLLSAPLHPRESEVLELSRQMIYQRVRRAHPKYSDDSQFVEIAPSMKYCDLTVAIHASRHVRKHTISGFSLPFAYTYFSFVPLGKIREAVRAESAKRAAGKPCNDKVLTEYFMRFHPAVTEFWKVGGAVRRFLAGQVHKGAGYDFANFLVAPTADGDIVVVVYDKTNLRKVASSAVDPRGLAAE